MKTVHLIGTTPLGRIRSPRAQSCRL